MPITACASRSSIAPSEASTDAERLTALAHEARLLDDRSYAFTPA